MSKTRGIHGEKLVAVLRNDRLPESDKVRINEAIEKYDLWIDQLDQVSLEGIGIEGIISEMVDLLNDYKLYLDLNIIFDSENDFLYRQKGQLKIDNTVVEEFLPIIVKKCISGKRGLDNVDISSQVKTYSSIHFNSSINKINIGGGISIRSKDQDFSMSRKLYLRSSYDPQFTEQSSVDISTNLGYVLAETKTNLDKTMFQEASATARDVKMAVSGCKYFLMCDYLDMTPISSSATYIDEILILRKSKRLNSNVRSNFSTYKGRSENRAQYEKYLKEYPYSKEIFERFINYIIAQLDDEDPIEKSVLETGYF
ncbi:Bpu10I family restriction endonuclease [Exiguobacterium sp. MH3]|uniref:Bpu10I family restriction endonuclease n=1 Tax=Exiguobacterium sp. MH3 TaxID=1399115 RepID=UPI0003C3C3C9|nr:Bpu10I family restriction endonuclease [Exiguobacterium sp. MH3]AHA28760.1 Bpu10I restriction endonuclease [Exiguobacterium sp. MH3]